MSKSKFSVDLVGFAGCAVILIWAAFWGTIIWVAYHFLSKYW